MHSSESSHSPVPEGAKNPPPFSVPPSFSVPRGPFRRRPKAAPEKKFPAEKILGMYGERVAQNLRYPYSPITKTYLISGGKSTEVFKAVRESTEALLGYDPEGARLVVSEKSWDGHPNAFREIPEIDEDAVWNGMLREASEGNSPLPDGLGSVVEDILSLRKERNDKDRKSKQKRQKPANAKNGADREAEKARKRQERRELREKQEQENPSEGKRPGFLPSSGPLYVSVKRAMSSSIFGTRVLEYLTGQREECPTFQEASTFVARIDWLLTEIAFTRGIRWSARSSMEQILDYRLGAMMLFPEIAKQGPGTVRRYDEGFSEEASEEGAEA